MPGRIRWSFSLFAAFALSACIGEARAQGQERYFEQDGILFREQRVVERRPVTQWQWEERQEVVYREEFTTVFREDQRIVQVPITMATSDGSPPVTRWETRAQIVRTPVVIRKMVPETRLARVPVRQLGFVNEERIARVPLGPAPPTTTASAPWQTPR